MDRTTRESAAIVATHAGSAAPDGAHGCQMNIEAIGTNGKGNGHFDHAAAAAEIVATNMGTAPDPAPEQPAKTLEVRTLRIADLVLDAAVHVRAQTDEKRVEQYAAEYLAGDAFPAIDVFDDGTTKIVANGFHRTRARAKAGFDDILCNVRPGGRREAILFALTQDRNLPRTNADKRKAATQLLSDPVWREWTDAVIARMCDVTPQFIGKLAKEMGVRNPIRKTANGRTIDTTRMGAKPTARKSRAEKLTQSPELSRAAATRNGFGSQNPESSAAAAPNDPSCETATNAPVVGASSSDTPDTSRADEVRAISSQQSVAPQTDPRGPEVGSDHDPVQGVLRLIRDLAADQRESVVTAAFHDLDEAARSRVLEANGTGRIGGRRPPAESGQGSAGGTAGTPTNDGETATRERPVSKQDGVMIALRARVETALLAGEIAEDDLIEAKVFSNRAHLGRFRRGGGLAADKIKALVTVLDARGASGA